MTGIYKITCTTSGHCYVGSSTNIRKRWALHRCDLRKNRHHSFILQRAWDKHGEAAFQFEVLESISDTSALRKREQAWIDQLKPRYNVSKEATPAPTRGRKMGPLGEETRRKISIANTGFRQSEERRKQASRMRKGRKLNLSDERREQLRQQLAQARKHRHTVAQRQAISEFMKQREHTEQSRQKRSEALKGKPWSQARQNAHLRVCQLREVLKRMGGTGKYGEAKTMIDRRGSAARALATL